ncbi:MAG TPA: 23S rRNA (adenine(2503)-C(2))-methyltransferase RlmN [bacterium]|nr:23S rRNA (adenine(2503)-C(2))-methyltransferase RlmN [bacterium]
MSQTIHLHNFTQPELGEFFKGWDVPAYTARQVFQWIYQKRAARFEEMTDLPKELREKLEAQATLTPLTLHTKQASQDGTTKYLWQLPPDAQGHTALVESVLIPMSRDDDGRATRHTACLSTQAGCRMKCTFCATGVPKFVRNLTTAEILGQILGMERDSGTRFNNVVVMGMGEPMDNYEPTQKAMRILHDQQGLNLGRRRITVSTSGLLENLKKFVKDDWPVSLAVSLHSADPEIRSRLMPVNRSNPLDQLWKVMRDFTYKRRLPVTLEYILLKGVNDRPEDAQKLERFCKDLLCKVNLIRYNPVPTLPFEAPDEARVDAFREDLKRRGLKVFLRERKGVDIAAACGQLGFENAPKGLS